ncbi:MAG: hypothetical protein WDO16_07575 [Bacteroidota bacterium]
MNIYIQNKTFYGQPIRLTEEQKKDPEKVFSVFFSDFDLYEIRERLAEWLECGLTSDNDEYAEANQRGSLLTMYERLEELIEAAYILSKQKKR